MTDSSRQGGFFPTPGQLFLLKASVFPPDEALVYWKRWLQTLDIRESDFKNLNFPEEFYSKLDRASVRILPIVWKNLEDFENEEITFLKRSSKGIWLKNQMLISSMAMMLELLGNAGIDHMIIKGIPLGLKYYKDPSLRVAGDGDILVPFDQKQAALHALAASPQGYRPGYLDRMMSPYLHAAHLHAANHTDIDLHWNLFGEHTGIPDIDNVFWEKSLAFDMQGTRTRVLSPTHQFFTSMAHGRYYDIPSPIRWINDCVVIARSAAINWDEVTNLAVRFRFVPFFREGLGLLQREFRIDVPESILRFLKNAGISEDEERYHYFARQPFDKSDPAGVIKRVIRSPLRRIAYYRIFRKTHERLPFILWYIKWGLTKILAWMPSLWKKDQD